MTTIKTGNGATKWLKANGFVPDQNCKKKIAGVLEVWNHDDGRKAVVGYCLYSSTSQSSHGAGACWGYTVSY